MRRLTLVATLDDLQKQWPHLLQMVGRTAKARMVFNELLIQMRRAPKYLRKAQAEWLSIAEKQLST
ncbi:hypothetical protein CWO91_14270 [Bradyrhizobium genosp. SA-3]|uniref:hypothetical protein n=1 Tax=unclassified Bradyrhizobium TaxID=2631580 RepID=UPI00088D037D|nr:MULTISPECIES: hypothetical protein [unclassified Bradyrhizobium]RZN10203.1 hypothetical protein CWO91_14270 [Bradyrhizobium genosp. SA-3]SDI03541.1 hypothetical protein SAMN05216338_1016128 [Bradyrhizobium sp. Rc2d]